ncbi:MAG: transketolase family protein [candidate division NC10 bacterium]|nr:transketolase family protein [candidate division NC10 bacterium]
MAERITLQSAYGEALKDLGSKVPNLVVLDADLSKITQTVHFAKAFPDRFFNVGIAEQDLMGIAAGLATTGMIPVAHTYACFATMRACEQVRTFIAYPNLNAKIVAMSAGIEEGWSGVTHQAIEDMAIMRTFPNMSVVAPSDAFLTKKATEAIIRHQGPVYMRLGRNAFPVIYDDQVSFTLGKAILLREGRDVTLIACGIMVEKALRAAEILEQEKISARVLDMHTIKPLDSQAVLAAAQETGALVTAEDHLVASGLGGSVAESLAAQWPTPLERIGLQDRFGETGAPDQLFEKYQMTEKHVAEAAKRAIRRKK